MSRSNPTTHSTHPCSRWFEWSGSDGEVRYYDKQEEKNVIVDDGFTFILLDQLSTIKGWHDASESGIHSNEVRDTKQEIFIVKAFKSQIPLAEGFYATIRDRIVNLGGHFTANLYIAFRDNGELKLGSLQFKGAALAAWMEFGKEHRSELYKKSVQIKGFTEGKKGKVTFRTPKFLIRDITEETNEAATNLDIELQKYLATYFSRTKTEQAQPQQPQREADDEPPVDHAPREPEPDSDIDIPFN